MALSAAVADVAAAGESGESGESGNAEESHWVERPWDFGIGLGFGELSNPFLGGDDVPLYLIVDFAYYGRKFFFDNGDLGLTLIDRPNLGINLIANYSSDRIYHSFLNELRFINVGGSTNRPPPIPGRGQNPDPNPEPDPVDLLVVGGNVDPETTVPFELPDRNFAVNFGMEFLLAGAWGDIHAQITQDVSGTHEGHELWLEYSRGWTFRNWHIEPSIGANWKSDDLVDYYYGIRRADNPQVNLSYQGSASVNLFAGLSLAYRVNPRLSLVGSFKYEHLGNEIENSPLIVDDHNRSIFVGTFWQF